MRYVNKAGSKPHTRVARPVKCAFNLLVFLLLLQACSPAPYALLKPGTGGFHGSVTAKRGAAPEVIDRASLPAFSAHSASPVLAQAGLENDLAIMAGPALAAQNRHPERTRAIAGASAHTPVSIAAPELKATSLAEIFQVKKRALLKPSASAQNNAWAWLFLLVELALAAAAAHFIFAVAFAPLTIGLVGLYALTIPIRIIAANRERKLYYLMQQSTDEATRKLYKTRIQRNKALKAIGTINSLLLVAMLSLAIPAIGGSLNWIYPIVGVALIGSLYLFLGGLNSREARNWGLLMLAALILLGFFVGPKVVLIVLGAIVALALLLVLGVLAWFVFGRWPFG